MSRTQLVTTRSLAVFAFLPLLSAAVFGGAGDGKSRALAAEEWALIKSSETGSEYLAGVILLKLKSSAGTLGKKSTGIATLDAAMEPHGVHEVQRIFPRHDPPADPNRVDLSRFVMIEYSSPIDPVSLAKELSGHPAVEYAEPKYVSSIEGIPNDPLYGSQWHLPKILAPEAWDITQGSTDVVIAIVDTGVDWNHPDLNANIWRNPGEIPANGVDDDNNGFVDDVVGWDFAGADFKSPDNDPSPGPGHGTHVGGIASAVTDNAVGVAGVGFNCRLMAIKTTRDAATETLIFFGYEGIVYAADNGADVINCSWGGPASSQYERDIIQYATEKGSVVVAAAGNDNTSADHFPSGHPHVLSVAWVRADDRKSNLSSYGPTVDVSAPGENILSTVPSGGYSSSWSGTSMASPVAAGIAALVKSVHPDWTPDQIGEQVRVSADPIDDLNLSYRRQLGFGRVNAFRALTVISPSVRLTGFSVDDAAGGDGDGILEPGETIQITVDMTNYLQSTSNTSLELTTTSTLVTIPSPSAALGPLGTLESRTNAASPFVVTISPSAPKNSLLAFTVLIDDGAYQDYASFRIQVNPTYLNHNINNIVMTVSSKGTLGFDDYPTNSLGDGFIFRIGNNLLFEGAFMAAIAVDRVVDVARDDPGDQQSADFQALQTVTVFTPGDRSDQETYSMFSDAGAGTNRVGLSVGLRTYAFRNLLDDNYIVLRYALHNTSGANLSNLYTGLYFDWDLGSAYENSAGYDGEKNLGYVYDVAIGGIPTYVGTTVLSHPSLIQFRAISNPATDPVNWGVWDGFTKQEKWIALSSGVSVTGVSATDASYVIGVGPLSIDAGDSTVVSYAVLAGDDLSALRSAVDAARAKWDVLSSISADERAPSLPSSFQLYQNYPNPFNPSAVISYDLARESVVRLSVYSILGEVVAILVDEKQRPAHYRVSIDASRWSSGVYLYRLEAYSTDGGRGLYLRTRKMMLVK